jgi:hypothetical protein
MDEESEKERQHWLTVLRTLLHYIDFYQSTLERRQRHLNRLPAAYAERLPQSSFDKLGALQSASQTNQDFLTEMVHFHFRNSFNTLGDTSDLPDKRQGNLFLTTLVPMYSLVHVVFILPQ